MPASLPRPLRRELENAVCAARKVAETGAREALEALAVGERDPFSHLTPQQRQLRVKLRAHGRALGDPREKDGRQALGHLVHAVAYEHWHRMLFARFLAENGCLLEPESGVAVSLTDVEELAREESEDLWALAGRYAEGMLPQVFRSDDPVLALQLPREARVKLESLLAGLSRPMFEAADALGWVYQFWQTEAKKAANDAGENVDARTLPAVTQLFTEDYMVEFLLHNTLGKLCGGRPLSPKEGIPGIEWTYLFSDSSSGGATGSGGVPPPNEEVPGQDAPAPLGDFKLLDPCMGSGHFLVFALPMLARLRMEEEGLSAPDAVRAVLRDNLHGLELDERCAQLAAFNLAVAAWRLCPQLLTDGKGLPSLNLAICGQGPAGQREDWLRVLEDGGRERLRYYLGAIYDAFEKAPVLGSLNNPEKSLGGLFDPADLDPLYQTIERAIARAGSADADRYETGVAAQGLARAFQLLARRYDLVATNVPYLARGKQCLELRERIEKGYPAGKADLATAFVLRCRDFLKPGGRAALVTPQNWLFLKSYDKLREILLRELQWDCVARLGPKAFETITGEVVNVALLTLTRQEPAAAHRLLGLDVSAQKTPEAKAQALPASAIHAVEQARQLENPDARITIEEGSDLPLLGDYGNAWQGIATSDFPRLGSNFWEFPKLIENWCFEQTTVENSILYGGKHCVLFWEDGYGKMTEVCQKGATFRGASAWGKPGVVVSQMRNLPVTLYIGTKFDNNSSVITIKNENLVSALWSFCNSPTFHVEVRKIDQSLKVTNSGIPKVPFDLDRWSKVAAERYPDGLPEPYSNDPTQWLFKGRVDDATDPLQVAVARLLGYRWPAEIDPEKAGVEVFESDRRHWEALAPFADVDGVIPLTALRGESPAADRLNALLHAAFEAARAHPYELPANWREDEIPAAPRPLGFASADAWIGQLLQQAGAGDLAAYLRDHFFEQHCKRFHNRPFIWHVWDGRPDGFHALVNYHKLCERARPRSGGVTPPDHGGPGRDAPAPKGAPGRAADYPREPVRDAPAPLLENLAYSYLGDWIRRQRDDASREPAVPGAEERLAAAEQLQRELVRILEGEPPCDLFIRWKPIHEQPIGWRPDINDGVRLNIRPFMKARDVKKKGAGILRHKPNVKWSKDRGKEPARPREDFPWFWGWDERAENFSGGADFDGKRWNDCHYTNEFKQEARERMRRERSNQP